MGEANQYSVALDGIPQNKRIIFKLICSVSARSKGRQKHYTLVNDAEHAQADILIRDGNNGAQTQSGANQHLVETLLADGLVEGQAFVIQRPLIATRVLTSLDLMVDEALKIAQTAGENTNAESKENDAESMQSQESEVNTKVENDESVEFYISEQEASELAIVHDESLANPANETETDSSPAAATVTPLRPAVENVETRSKLIEIMDETSETPTRIPESTSSHCSEIPRALVVDDSPSVRKQLELELALFHVDVDYAADAAEANNLLAANDYDVAFLDVVLPDKDGFQICKEIKQTSKHTKIVMLTGKASQADKIKGALAGCDDYLVKPVGRMTFQAAVQNYLTLRQQQPAVEA